MPQEETKKGFGSVGLSQLMTSIKASLVRKADTETLTALDVDSTPTASSAHLVTSGGVHTAVSRKYTKPSGGIPSTDLTDAVQTSLGKADTALQSHQSLAAYRTSAAQDVIDGGKESSSNKVTSVTSASTDVQYPSAKCVYDIVGNIEATLNEIRGV